MNAADTGRNVGTGVGLGVVLAETLGFHPLGMLIGITIAVASRRIGASSRAGTR